MADTPGKRRAVGDLDLDSLDEGINVEIEAANTANRSIRKNSLGMLEKRLDFQQNMMGRMINKVVSLSDEQSRPNSLANDLVQKLNAVLGQLGQCQQTSVAQAEMQKNELLRQQGQQKMAIEEASRRARNVSELATRDEQRTRKIQELDQQARWLKNETDRINRERNASNGENEPRDASMFDQQGYPLGGDNRRRSAPMNMTYAEPNASSNSAGLPWNETSTTGNFPVRPTAQVLLKPTAMAVSDITVPPSFMAE